MKVYFWSCLVLNEDVMMMFSQLSCAKYDCAGWQVFLPVVPSWLNHSLVNCSIPHSQSWIFDERWLVEAVDTRGTKNFVLLMNQMYVLKLKLYICYYVKDIGWERFIEMEVVCPKGWTHATSIRSELILVHLRRLLCLEFFETVVFGLHDNIRASFL